MAHVTNVSGWRSWEKSFPARSNRSLAFSEYALQTDGKLSPELPSLISPKHLVWPSVSNFLSLHQQDKMVIPWSLVVKVESTSFAPTAILGTFPVPSPHIFQERFRCQKFNIASKQRHFDGSGVLDRRESSQELTRRSTVYRREEQQGRMSLKPGHTLELSWQKT